MILAEGRAAWRSATWRITPTNRPMPQPKKRPQGVKPCATCPFRTANLGKPNPPGWDEKPVPEGFDGHDWYAPKNLRRIWNGARREGATLQCHCTVEDHAPHVGKRAKPGHVALCSGAVYLVAQHVTLYTRIVEAASEAGRRLTPTQAMRLYRPQAGKLPLTRDGMVQQAINLTMPPMFGGLGTLVPASFDGQAITELGVPWHDPLTTPAGLEAAITEATAGL
jgi:hypothetical protein